MSTRATAVQPRVALGDPIMSLALTSDGPAKRITVRGEIDTSNAHLLIELVEHVVDQRPSCLVLDLADVVFLGAYAVGALLQAKRATADVGVPLVLENPSHRVRYILAVTGAGAEFELPPPDDQPGRNGVNGRAVAHLHALHDGADGPAPLDLWRATATCPAAGS